MKRTHSLIILAMAFALAGSPRAALAEKHVRLQASFAVAFAAMLNSPPVAYCGQRALDYKLEAHGDVTHR